MLNDNYSDVMHQSDEIRKNMLRKQLIQKVIIKISTLGVLLLHFDGSSESLT